MKKILFTIIFTLIAFCANAQFFVCDKFQEDLIKYEQIQNTYKSKGNKKWSQELLKCFPIAKDGTIEYSYIIKSDSIFNVEDMNNMLLNWYKINVPNSIPNTLGSIDHLSIICVLNSVGKAIGYMNATFINAKEEITIDIKENRIRIICKILQYISANTWNGAEVTLPGSCFPINKDGKQKDSHAMAFINCNFNVLSTVNHLIKYLNDNYTIIKNGDVDW